jgi:hypothetical protein
VITVSAEPSAPLLASPCVGTCRLDATTGWCIGCARDARELTSWRELGARERAAVWAELPGRKARLGLRFRLAPWSPVEALRRLAAAHDHKSARIAVAAFPPWPALGLTLDADRLAAGDSSFRLLLRPDPGLRLFELADRRVLAVHRSRLSRLPTLIGEVGPDRHALDPADRDAVLFDLGWGATAGRIALRTRDAAALRHLRGRCGSRFAGEPLPGDVTTVIALPIGRVELSGPPPARLTPPVDALPEAYVACIAFLNWA